MADLVPLSDYSSWGDPNSQGYYDGNMVTLKTPWGSPVTVNKGAAPAFGGFFQELAGTGYQVNSVGGYSNRPVTGGTTPSPHAYGLAVDINPDANPYSKDESGGKLTTNMPPGIGAMANKYGLSWGGDWHSLKDPMHFEFTGTGPYPSQARSLPLQSPSPQQAFFSSWAPYAKQAGDALGVNPNTILAQWAHESDFGRSVAAKNQGNVAGLNVPGATDGSTFAGFKNPQDFTNAYISTLMHPGYAAARGTGNDPAAFVKGLVSTPGHHYFTADPGDYTKRIMDIASGNPMGKAGTPIQPGLAMGGGGGGLQFTHPSTGSGLALPPPPPAQDPNLALALLGKLAPNHSLQPVPYNPFVTPTQDSNQPMPGPIQAPRLHAMPPARAPVLQSQAPGARGSPTGGLTQVLGDTGTPSTRGRPAGAGETSQYG